jgi:hypothetical protein
MSRREVRGENPDRLYTVTGGRSRVDQDSLDSLDMVTLIVSESAPTAGMQSEYVSILQLCGKPMAVVELSSHLGLPVSVVKILVADLLGAGQVSARHPSATRDLPLLPQRATARRPASRPPLPDPAFLKEVLIGLEKL